MTLLDKLKKGKEKVVKGIKDVEKEGFKGTTLRENLIKPSVKKIKEYEASHISLKKLREKLDKIGCPTDGKFIEENIGEISPLNSFEKNAAVQYTSAGVGVGSMLGFNYAIEAALRLTGYELPAMADLAYFLASWAVGIGAGLYTLEKMGEHFPSLNSVYLKEELRPEVTEEDLEW